VSEVARQPCYLSISCCRAWEAWCALLLLVLLLLSDRCITHATVIIIIVINTH
jgi:hypothetical protein